MSGVIFGSLKFLELLYVIGGVLTKMATKGFCAEKFCYGFKSLAKLGVENFFFKIPIGRTFLKFSFKTSFFLFSIKKNHNFFRFRDF